MSHTDDWRRPILALAAPVAAQRLAAFDEKKLLVYWTRDRGERLDFNRPLAELELALIHQDYLHAVPALG